MKCPVCHRPATFIRRRRRGPVVDAMYRHAEGPPCLLVTELPEPRLAYSADPLLPRTAAKPAARLKAIL